MFKVTGSNIFKTNGKDLSQDHDGTERWYLKTLKVIYQIGRSYLEGGHKNPKKYCITLFIRKDFIFALILEVIKMGI